MNFQQLRIIRETIRCNYNLTEAANALFTSQPGISKHIKDLEEELGVELFVRKGKRLLGLTEPGRELAFIVNRLLLEAENIRQLAAHFRSRDQGKLVIATTHTQARYALPAVVARFKQAFPKVQLVLHQASPCQISEMLLAGEADLGIATEGLHDHPELHTLPYYEWQHAVVVPNDHPLAQRSSITLEELAGYPLVTYHPGVTGRANIDQAFQHAGLHPEIVMSALDADVIKTYVELGLGVGIIAAMAYQPERDSPLTLLASDGLFAPNTSRLILRRGHYLRDYTRHFIELCSPEVNLPHAA